MDDVTFEGMSLSLIIGTHRTVLKENFKFKSCTVFYSTEELELLPLCRQLDTCI